MLPLIFDDFVQRKRNNANNSTENNLVNAQAQAHEQNDEDDDDDGFKVKENEKLEDVKPIKDIVVLTIYKHYFGDIDHIEKSTENYKMIQTKFRGLIKN